MILRCGRDRAFELAPVAGVYLEDGGAIAECEALRMRSSFNLSPKFILSSFRLTTGFTFGKNFTTCGEIFTTQSSDLMAGQACVDCISIVHCRCVHVNR